MTMRGFTEEVNRRNQEKRVEGAAWQAELGKVNKATREVARQDVFEYIEMFYNPKRKHTNNGMLSPIDFENRQRILKAQGV